MTPQGGWHTTYTCDKSGGSYILWGGGIHRRIRYERFAGIPLLQLLYRGCTARVLLKFEVWVGIVQVVFRMARPHNTYTRNTRNNTLRSGHKKKTLEYGCCCTLHGCHNVKSLAFGVKQARSSRQHRQSKRT